jgi:hypothetical protein
MHELGGSWQPLSHRRDYGLICILQKFGDMIYKHTIHMLDLKEENVIFQHDNKSKHSSKYVKD